MTKKLKTPLYTTVVKPLLTGALAASKIVTGPWGWLATTAAPKLLDLLIKPMFVWYREWKQRRKDKKEAKAHVKKLNEASTPDDYRDALNSRVPKSKNPKT